MFCNSRTIKKPCTKENILLSATYSPFNFNSLDTIKSFVQHNQFVAVDSVDSSIPTLSINSMFHSLFSLLPQFYSGRYGLILAGHKGI